MNKVVTIRNNTKNKRISVCDGATKRRIIRLGDVVHRRGRDEELVVGSIKWDGTLMLMDILTAEVVMTNVHNVVKNREVAV